MRFNFNYWVLYYLFSFVIATPAGSNDPTSNMAAPPDFLKRAFDRSPLKEHFANCPFEICLANISYGILNCFELAVNLWDRHRLKKKKENDDREAINKARKDKDLFYESIGTLSEEWKSVWKILGERKDLMTPEARLQFDQHMVETDKALKGLQDGVINNLDESLLQRLQQPRPFEDTSYMGGGTPHKKRRIVEHFGKAWCALQLMGWRVNLSPTCAECPIISIWGKVYVAPTTSSSSTPAPTPTTPNPNPGYYNHPAPVYTKSIVMPGYGQGASPQYAGAPGEENLGMRLSQMQAVATPMPYQAQAQTQAALPGTVQVLSQIQSGTFIPFQPASTQASTV